MDIFDQLQAVADSKQRETFELPTGGILTFEELSASDFVRLQAEMDPHQKARDFSTVNALTIVNCCIELREDKEKALEIVKGWPRTIQADAVLVCGRINGITDNLPDHEKKA